MAILPSLLLSRSPGFPPQIHDQFTRSSRVSNSALICSTCPEFSLHSHNLNLSCSTSPCPTSISSRKPVEISLCSFERCWRPFLSSVQRPGCVLGLGVVAGTMMVLPEYAHASEIVSNLDSWSSLVASEPKNALSLPTWVIHVASVAEWFRARFVNRSLQTLSHFPPGLSMWPASSNDYNFRLSCFTVVLWWTFTRITAMGLVWRYGDTPGNSSWKGLSWGMVPLLGGAMCACTWHFFYNAQSLEILVVLQAALTVIGNFTMWAAAFRIYQASQKESKAP